MPLNRTTPGVYIQEQSAFPNSVLQVETAVPAFIGYTPQVNPKVGAKLFEPLLIASMGDFLNYFGYPADPKTGKMPPQYTPAYYLTPLKKAPDKGQSYTLNGTIYAIEPDPATVWYLYASLLLFFENGGQKAYIVSVGTYGLPSNAPIQPGDPLVNPNVKLAELQQGLECLKKEASVTMYVFPEATLLSVAENGTLMETTLRQCGEMQTAMAFFDIIGARTPDPTLWEQDIQTFRENTGTNGLSYGTAYYPFLKTTAFSADQVTVTNVQGDTTPLNDPATQKQILAIILEQMNVLPPSGVMAGIYALTDANYGVWQAPANVAPISVSGLTKLLTDDEQAGLNVDVISGKSINAFRSFPGRGILVWGARTLDGNSADWMYISVRRTATMIEQSIKLALRSYVVQPNDPSTWTFIKAMLENFLNNIWKEGALQGAKPDEAFSVQIGLGVTMTAQDILDGYFRVTVLVAIKHPAEFMVITLEQDMVGP
ncbi:MAG: phage tail sheath family protein [Saprospiraceae bacterium]|nr:phage tail sheath family protein [Saprospiraceae bacterium]